MTETTRIKEQETPRVASGKMVCPQCHSKQFKQSTTQWECLSCATTFPVLFDTIPVLMLRAKEHISQTYLQFRQYLLEEKQKQKQLQEAIKNDSFRKENLSLLVHAIQHNNNLIESLKEQLTKHLLAPADMIEYLHQQPATPLQYATNFDYLRRDWSGFPEGELELKQIKDGLEEALEIVKPKVSKALVLGAGMGRIAYDLTTSVEQVIAIDQSISMAAWYQKISQTDLPFYEVNPKNAQHFTDRVRPLTASMSDKSRVDNLSFCIGDALALPMAEQSADAIISAYFTDVTPLEKLLPEVNRVLRPGGAFIHFGPLQYHFSDLSKMLSYEEVKAFFEKNNFAIHLEKRVKTTHCSSSLSSLQKEYNNWLLVALKQEPIEWLPIRDDSVLQLLQTIHYEITGQLQDHTEKQLAVELKIKGKNFEGAETILDLLRLIDGQRTFVELLRKMEEIYGQFEENEIIQIKEIVERLRKEEVIGLIP